MGTRALAVLLLVPSLALAQAAGQATLSVFPRTTFDKTEINRAECGSTTSNVTVSYLPAMATGQTLAAGDKYRFFTGTSACSATLPTSGSFAPDVNANDNVNVQTLDVAADALRGALSLSCTQANDTTYYICVYLTASDLATVKGTASSGALTFQMAIPPQPSISVASASSALEVSVTPGATDTTHQATASVTYLAVATPMSGAIASVGPTSSTSIRIDNLTNGLQYSVVVTPYSSAGNPGPPSAPFLQEPKYFADFWQAYQAAGGREQGGCGGGAGALSLLALLPLAMRRRRA